MREKCDGGYAEIRGLPSLFDQGIQPEPRHAGQARHRSFRIGGVRDHGREDQIVDSETRFADEAAGPVVLALATHSQLRETSHKSSVVQRLALKHC